MKPRRVRRVTDARVTHRGRDPARARVVVVGVSRGGFDGAEQRVANADEIAAGEVTRRRPVLGALAAAAGLRRRADARLSRLSRPGRRHERAEERERAPRSPARRRRRSDGFRHRFRRRVAAGAKDPSERPRRGTRQRRREEKPGVVVVRRRRHYDRAVDAAAAAVAASAVSGSGVETQKRETLQSERAVRGARRA